MTSRHSLSRYFDHGAGHVVRYHGDSTLFFQWHGRPDGAARYVEHVKLYVRNGVEHKSLAALLRAVEAEHANKRAADAAVFADSTAFKPFSA